jgi:carbon monoxide dehydrogenase subunit G
MRIRTLLLPLAILTLPVVAHADPEPEPAKDPQVVRLLDAKKTLKWNQTVGSSKDKYGHAECLVEASADVVAKKAAEFGQYKTLHKKFQSARVINKDGDNTDVYMRYPVQIGFVTFEFSEVMRFKPTRSAGSSFVIEGNGIKGDMKTGHTIITVKPVDAKHSLLQVDVLLVPSIPAPQSLIDEELRDGAQDFVNGLKDKSQGWVGPVTAL